MTTREKCRRLVTAGVTASEAARRHGIKPATVRKWAERGHWKNNASVTHPVTPPAIPDPPKPQWMQSFNHESAHLVDFIGRAVCDPERITGIVGQHWQKHDFVKKCRRCMGWEALNPS